MPAADLGFMGVVDGKPQEGKFQAGDVRNQGGAVFVLRGSTAAKCCSQARVTGNNALQSEGFPHRSSSNHGERQEPIRSRVLALTVVCCAFLT